ncbi:Memo-like protein [uncultured archaeon]|nr:Memo-like protein [uncultured archaeon]
MKSIEKKEIRRQIHAGTFYPAEKKELSSMIKKFLSQAKTKKLEGELAALIVPHAGYIYSGFTAAFAYNVLQKASPKKITLLGPSHYHYIKGAYSFSAPWETPLGELKVREADFPIVKKDVEHSLEVQAPFLQTVLANFDFTPIMYGEISPDVLAGALLPLAKGTVIIASSDLSHFFKYEEAKQIDAVTINAILDLDFEEFMRTGDACGKTGIAALILLAKRNKWKPILLDYRNSGDTAGSKEEVVGYASIAFVK